MTGNQDRAPRRGDRVYPGGGGGPREQGACAAGGDHRLKRASQGIREVAVCTKCAASWAKPILRPDASGRLIEVSGFLWTVVDLGRRVAPPDTHGQLARAGVLRNGKLPRNFQELNARRLEAMRRDEDAEIRRRRGANSGAAKTSGSKPAPPEQPVVVGRFTPPVRPPNPRRPQGTWVEESESR